MSARATIQAFAEKEVRKRLKKQKLAILVSSDEDSDYSSDSKPDTKYNSLHPELVN
jgi:predicted pyridoxine 5'-phosphate oxidase superfamily flavin-nucleotide-binding protein